MIALLIAAASAAEPRTEVREFFGGGWRPSLGVSALTHNVASGGTETRVWPTFHLIADEGILHAEVSFVPDGVSDLLDLHPRVFQSQLEGDGAITSWFDIRMDGIWLTNPKNESPFGLRLDLGFGATMAGHGTVGRGLTTHIGPALYAGWRVGTFLLQADARLEPGLLKFGGQASSSSGFIGETMHHALPNVFASTSFDLDHESGVFLHLRANRALSWESNLQRLIRYDVGVGYRFFSGARRS